MIFNKPTDLCRIDKPSVTVVIDVEEEFAWDGRFSANHKTVSGDGNLPAGQAVFDKYNVAPAYLLDLPAIRSEAMTQCLKSWAAEGRCEMGTQLHTWVTPPHDEVVCLENSYQRNLPPALEQEKIRFLSNSFEEVFDQAPRIFKAGRYGLGPHTARFLQELGYHVDTSVVPYTDYSHFGGGADFIGVPGQPFWIDAPGGLMELPITRGPVGLLRHCTNNPMAYLFDSPRLQRIKLPGIIASLGILERISLSPESTELDDMIRLVKAMSSRGKNVFSIWFHSSSLVAEGTPYSAQQSDVTRLLERLDSLLDFLINKMDVQPVSVSQLREIAMGGKMEGPSSGRSQQSPEISDSSAVH